MFNNNSRAGVVVGLALIGLGVLFLLQQFFNFNIWDTLWPFIVIGVGGLLISAAMLGGRESAGLFVPGSIVTVVGLILLVLNLTDHWEAWAYAWTLIIAAVGAGLWLMGLRTGNDQQRRQGQQTVQTGLVMLLIFGAFFELVVFGSPQVTRWAGPALLIAVGGFLLLRTLLGGRKPTLPGEADQEVGTRPQ